MPYVFSHMPCVIFPVCFHLWEIGCQSEKTASPRTLVLSFFLSFSESGQTEKGNGTGINLTGKAFCPGNTPKRDLLNKKREKYAKIMLMK